LDGTSLSACDNDAGPKVTVCKAERVERVSVRLSFKTRTHPDQNLNSIPSVKHKRIQPKALTRHPLTKQADMPPRARDEQHEGEEEDITVTSAPTTIDPYAILSDQRRRNRYDITGRTEDSLDLDDDAFDWVSYYREQYKDVITADAIEEFASKYKGSEEERGDVLGWYEKCEGKMMRLYKNVMLSDPAADEERFRELIDQAIESGEVEAYEAYTEESEASRNKRVNAARKRKEKEAKEAERHAEDLGIGKDLKKKVKGKKEKDDGMGDLAALIGQRQNGRSDNFLADLEAKYAPKGKAKAGAKRAMDEPSEEAFAKTEASRRSKRSKK